MYLRVKEAHYISHYKVDVKFNDGTSQTVDFAPFLKRATNPMFAQYRRVAKFKKFHVDHGDLMWGDFEMIFPVTDLHKGKIGPE